MHVLCVAEKPSVAKTLTEILSSSRYDTRPSADMYVKNFDFTYNLNNRPTRFTMTALRGHITELHFDGAIDRNWNDYPFEDLFHVPLRKAIAEQSIALSNNIRHQIGQCDVLFIWTDCDREGEAIGGDVADLCREVNPRIQVWRARFSTMQPQEIHHAAQNHSQLDMRQVEAVRIRTELDFRIGAAFTRLQTTRLRPHFHRQNNKVVSYGSCQFPTLGFVVDRYQQIQNFIPEQFWKIVLSYIHRRDDGTELVTMFKWRREHLFDQWACFILYEICFEKKIATVTQVKSKQTSKWKPLPLTTVELQKVACRALRMSGHQIMNIAEKLYSIGLISYPRTETDQFDPDFDFMTLINMQTSDPQWGQYAQLLRDGEFERPRNGRGNDKAHPPIHPTKYSLAGLNADEKRVYEFIVRRFLGCCWKNALGHETTVEVKMDTEYFDAKGLVILERNYLEVYTYDRWNGNEIPIFVEGDEFIPDTLKFESGHTTPPQLLTEPDLISLMEKNEIGTDATIAEHIQRVIDRGYIFKENQYFKPLTLGIALVLGYDQIDFEASLSKPFLRRQMEADLRSICEGNIGQDEVLTRGLARYREMFQRTIEEFSRINASMNQYFRDDDDARHNAGQSGGGNGNGGFGGGRGGDGGGRGGGSGRGSGRGNNNSNGGNNGGRGRGRGRGRGGGFSSSNGGGFQRQGPPPEPPTCKDHKRPMVLRTVNKAGPNKGREFYTCTEDISCSFEWADDQDANTARNTNNASTRNNNSGNATPFCKCGKNSVERTVRKEGPNKGRPFYCCSAGKDTGCDYFEWVDQM
ncbi:unnamed protein product [Mucor circinelloides]|uniref:DNA topoisomerase n=1 Tax=Mucor circinelloides f. circinelloides (strain 1006PhL) TaxID=1220926 RepID=S2JN43_MUCC1|nr:hypothetical protein HMPREF1544_12086 [Mucor circinelloides 1006PhL]